MVFVSNLFPVPFVVCQAFLFSDNFGGFAYSSGVSGFVVSSVIVASFPPLLSVLSRLLLANMLEVVYKTAFVT